MWGKVSLYLGVALILVSVALGRKSTRFAKVILGVGYFILALLQVPPILLWFAFHGSGIAGGPSSFVAHWGYSIPHIMLLTVSIIILYRLRYKPCNSSSCQ